MAWAATFAVAANVLSAGLRIREVTEVFLFVDLGDWSRGLCRVVAAKWRVVVAAACGPSRSGDVVANAYKFESKRSAFS